MKDATGSSSNVLARSAIVALIGAFLLVLYLLLKKIGASDPVFQTVIEMIKEVGFACIVSIIIWLTFEFFSSSEREREWKRRISDINDNVFQAILQRRLPPELVESVTDNILRQDFLRKDFEIEYTLKKGEIKIDKGQAFNFVQAESITSFSLVNVSETTKHFEPRFQLSGHRHSSLNQFCKAIKIIVEESHVTKDIDLAAANADFQSRLTDKDTLFKSGHIISIEPDVPVRIIMHISFVKDVADTELFLTNYASDSIRLTIHDHSGYDLNVGATSIHFDELSELPTVSGSRTRRFELRRHLLPNQGLQFWWTRSHAP